MRLSFLGGVGTVTGSKYLIESDGRTVLIDCGLFQGLKQLRLQNWGSFPVDPASIDAVILTHAHLDHSGYLPLLIRNGFRGPVYCTSATRDLCAILLPDSGYLQERDAEYANRHGFSKHKPALPLYTEAEARNSLGQFITRDFEVPHEISTSDLTFRFHPSGHILGSAFVQIATPTTNVLFSGDLGRPNSPTMVDPAVVKSADYLLVESTYGNRTHDVIDPTVALAEVISRTAQRGGSVLVPTFAVGRVQTLLFYLFKLKAARLIPDLPIYLDSPMAVDASHIFCDHLGEHRLTPEECHAICQLPHYVNSVTESKGLDHNPMPKIILSASGMATGGRVLHHLKALAPDRRNTILFTGFQAEGTRGGAMVAGATSVKIHGTHIPIHAEVQSLGALSAHADRQEILTWLERFEVPPRMTFITHGSPESADALRLTIEERLKWRCRVPEQFERVDLTSDTSAD